MSWFVCCAIAKNIASLDKLGQDLNANPFGGRVEKSEFEALCKRKLDNESFVLSEFEAQGYRTAMSEDWQVVNIQTAFLIASLGCPQFLPATTAGKR